MGIAFLHFIKSRSAVQRASENLRIVNFLKYYTPFKHGTSSGAPQTSVSLKGRGVKSSGWTRRKIRARPSSTNTERPPEDVPWLPQTAANMKALGTNTVCKPEPEIPEWTY